MTNKDKLLIEQGLRQVLSHVSTLKKQVQATKTALQKAEDEFNPLKQKVADTNLAALDTTEQALREQIDAPATAEDIASFDPTVKLSAALKTLARGCGCSNLKAPDS